MLGRIIKKPSGSSNIYDLLNLTSVQLFMPFTDNLLDNSIYSRTVTNVGVSLGSNGAIYDSTSDRLLTKITLDDFTIEAIFTGYSINEGLGRIVEVFQYEDYSTNSLFGVNVYNGLIRLIDKLEATYASTTIQRDKTYHFSMVRKNGIIRLYLDGILLSGEINNSVQVKSIKLGSVYDNSRGYIGTIGGIKVTSKALEPSQFSLLRPMELKYPSFKIGTREYVYKDGVWNPAYEKTQSAGVAFESSRIKIPQSSNLDITTGNFTNKKLYVEFSATIISGGISNSSLFYVGLLDATNVVKTIVYNINSNIESNNINRVIAISYTAPYIKARLKAEASQLVYVTSIYIE